jgi:Icc-related predicted phosphoesterase
MKFVFATDLHGVAALYRRLADLCRQERPDALLLGGDLFPDGRRPDPHREQIRFVREFLVPWLEALRGTCPDARVLTVFGNHDWKPAVSELAEAGRATGLAFLSHSEGTEVEGYTLFGYSDTPATPFWVKDHERLDTPEDRQRPIPGRCFVSGDGAVREADPDGHFLGRATICDELAAAPTGPDGRTIWVTHCPPAGSAADMMYGPRHVGSIGVRRLIERTAPAITLHGHVHEAPAISGAFAGHIGRTLVINPGRTYDSLDAVVFDPSDPTATLRHTRLGCWRAE